jgi:WD40 repeat protein
MEIVQTPNIEEVEFLPFGDKKRVSLLDCAFSPDGATMTVSGMYSEIVAVSLRSLMESARTYQVHAPILTQRLQGHGKPVTSTEWLSDTLVVSSSADATVGVFDVSTGTRVRRYRGHEGIVNCVRAVDANLFASAGDDGWLRIWDERIGARKGAVVSTEHQFPITSLAAREAYGVSKVWYGTLDNDIFEFDVISGRSKKLATLNAGICGLTLNEDCTALFARTFTGQMWRCSRLGEAQPLTAGKPNYRQKHLSRIVSRSYQGMDCCIFGEEDGSVPVVSNGGPIARSLRHAADATVGAVAVHGNLLASCASDGTLRVGNFSF